MALRSSSFLIKTSLIVPWAYYTFWLRADFTPPPPARDGRASLEGIRGRPFFDFPLTSCVKFSAEAIFTYGSSAVKVPNRPPASPPFFQPHPLHAFSFFDGVEPAHLHFFVPPIPDRVWVCWTSLLKIKNETLDFVFLVPLFAATSRLHFGTFWNRPHPYFWAPFFPFIYAVQFTQTQLRSCFCTPTSPVSHPFFCCFFYHFPKQGCLVLFQRRASHQPVRAAPKPHRSTERVDVSCFCFVRG